MNDRPVFFVGLLLCLAGVAAAVYSVRAARAQCIYYSVKYGRGSQASIAEIASRSEISNRLYSHNYELAAQMCRNYLHSRDSVLSSDDGAALAELWCRRGLAMDPYQRVLRYTEAVLLARKSPSEAACAWEKFVDWQYWSSLNLSALVQFYAQAGRLAEAGEVLSLLKGHPGYAKAAAAFKHAWASEMRAPSTH